MATPINELPAAGTVTGAEEIAVNQSGSTVKMTVQEIANYTTTDTTGLPTQLLVGGGFGNPPVWVTATGSDAPVRATSPVLVSPTLGNATATSLALGTALPITSGGTGKTVAIQAFDALSPLTSAGDLLTHDGSTATRLAKGAPLQALRMNGAGTAVEWTSTVGDAFQNLPLSQFATTSSAQLRGVMSDETGTGSLVFNTSPSLTTPSLGVATAEGLTLTDTPLPITSGGTGNILARDAFDALAPSTTKGDLIVRNNSHNVRFPVGAALTVLQVNAGGDDLQWSTLPGGGNAMTSDPLSQFAATTSAQLAGVITDETGSGKLVFADGPTLTTPVLGIPASGTLTNCTGLPLGGVTGLGANVATWLATPSSSNLIAAVTDETGSGSLVFSDSPTLVTPNLGTPSAAVLTNATGTAAGLTAGNATLSAATNALKSATTTIDVASATAPVLGQVLTASDSTHATWTTLNYTPSVMTTAGDIIYGGVAGAATRLGIGGANTVLHGGSPSPSYSAVVEADITLSANSTNDATTVRHGFLPALSGVATQFLNGQGNFAIPSGLSIANSYSLTSFSATTTISVVHNFGTYPAVQVVLNTGAVMIPQSIVHNTLNDFTVTLSSSSTGNVIATLGSPQPQQLLITAANYTVLATDRIIKVTAAGKVITLLTAVGNTGREFKINNASNGNITVNTTSSQTISNSLTQSLPSYSSMTVYSDGANWWII